MPLPSVELESGADILYVEECDTIYKIPYKCLTKPIMRILQLLSIWMKPDQAKLNIKLSKIMLIVLIILNILFLFLLRNHLVNKHHIKAIEYIYEQDNWESLKIKYNPTGNYGKHMLDLRKWSYNQMFPGLE